MSAPELPRFDALAGEVLADLADPLPADARRDGAALERLAARHVRIAVRFDDLAAVVGGDRAPAAARTHRMMATACGETADSLEASLEAHPEAGE